MMLSCQSLLIEEPGKILTYHCGVHILKQRIWSIHLEDLPSFRISDGLSPKQINIQLIMAAFGGTN